MVESWTPSEDDAPGSSELGDVGEEMPVEDDQPRRAASARFDVAPTVGTEAAMRDAMDPANQSLGDALRLSYRLLQFVIVVLVVLFLASGFQSVDEGQTGVLTVWGKKRTVNNEEALEPGLQMSVWPYPIAEFLLFQAENRVVETGDKDAFWPDYRGKTFDAVAESATVNEHLTPGQHGSVLTRDGDLLHMRVAARYEITDPARFVEVVADKEANRLVRLSLQKSTIAVVGTMSLSEVIDAPQAMTDRIRQETQRDLDALECGIQIVDVTTPQSPTPPAAIARTASDLQEARSEARSSIEQARDKAGQLLLQVAGSRADELLGFIEQYEDAMESSDEPRKAELMASINAIFDSPDLSGEVSSIIQQARAYQLQVESTLGNEARRFLSVLPSYREHPELFVRQRWLETYSRVIARSDAEPIYVPAGVGDFVIKLTGSDEVRQFRRSAYLKRKEDEANRRTYDPLKANITYGADMSLGGPGRQFNVKDGKIQTRNTGGSSSSASGSNP